MKFRSLLTAICVLAAAQIVSAAPFAYIANSGTKNVSVIDTADNTVKATVTLPSKKNDPSTLPNPYGIAVGASGQYVYVGLKDSNEIAIIDTTTNTITDSTRITWLAPDIPGGLAVNAAETRLYVTSSMSNTLIIIDLTVPGGREVGRKYLGNPDPNNYQPKTNPEGVVINPAGTKAYVANSITDTIAEVTLDEVNNNYSVSLIDSGAASYPMGLAISADGAKLYFSSMNGNNGVIDTSTKAVTTLSAGTDFGFLSVARNPVSNDVYFPSNSFDKLYAFNSAGTALAGSPFAPVAAGPFGSSVTPDGAKLFITMNYGADPNYDVKVYNTAGLGFLASIPLPLGAKPTSFGNFIGPIWDHTIKATATAPCTITPASLTPGVVDVPVNSHGWTFRISGTGCDVKIDGLTPDKSVGMVSSYTFTNVTTNTHTIDASQITGTYYTLNINPPVITSVNGYLVSNPAGLNQNITSAQFQSGTSPSVNAANGFKAINWTGACAGTPDGSACSIPFVNLSADKTFSATVVLNTGGPIFDVTSSSYYQTWTACTSAVAASVDFIKLSTDITSLTTDGIAGYQYKLSSQWSKSDYSQKGTYTPLVLTITNVGVIADDLTL